MRDLFQRLQRARRIDLGQTLAPGIPHWPTHPPFIYGLTKAHGEAVLEGGVSAAADSIAMGTHTGTHLDALCHFSCDGLLHQNYEVSQTYTGGQEHLAVDTVAPIVRRGVLLDLAAHEQCDILPADYEATPAALASCAGAQGAVIEEGDVVLLRTGWARYWPNPRVFVNDGRTPGPALAGAGWLSSHRPFAVGSDTLAFERIPSPRMEVHHHLLVERGVHIVEVLNLEELAEAGIHEFLFIAAPLRIRGATGSPLRPFALVEEY
jgi:kynurenine formamidase